MSLKRWSCLICFIVLLLSGNIDTYSKEVAVPNQVVKDIGYVGLQYRLEFNEPRAVLSRDGSVPIPVVTKTKITKPGTYFLSTFDVNNQLKITSFKIGSSRGSASWSINTESDLVEAIKDTLENYRSEVLLYFKYGNFDINQLNVALSNKVDQVTSDYPKLTFENYTLITAGGKNPTVKLRITYPDNSPTLLKKYDTQLEKQVVTILNSILKPTMNAYEREFAIYDYIANAVTYEKLPLDRIHTLQGALIEGKAVCDGYTKAFMYLLNATGTETRKVVGTGRGIDHAWNLVKLEGDYYHVDVTFGDSDENQIGNFYDYFNETDDYMAKNHVWDRTEYPKSSSEKLSLMYLPINVPGVYKVSSTIEWYGTMMDIKAKKMTEGSIVFYDVVSNNWNIQKLVQEFANTMRKDLTYMVVEKYNGKVVSFRLQ